MLYINERLVLNCIFLLKRIEPFFYKKIVDIATFKTTLKFNTLIYHSSQWKQKIFESSKYYRGDSLSFINGLLHNFNTCAVIPGLNPEEYSEIWKYGELMHAKRA